MSEAVPERTCLVTREALPRDGLVRFVVDGETLVPDLAERLPGRGAWVGANRERIEAAVQRGLFHRAFRKRVEIPDFLPDRLRDLAERRLLEGVGLARRAGVATFGRDRCLAAIERGEAGVLVVASDAGTESRRMNRAASTNDVPVGAGPAGHRLGERFGVDRVSFATIAPGALAERVARDLRRWSGLCASEADGKTR